MLFFSPHNIEIASGIQGMRQDLAEVGQGVVDIKNTTERLESIVSNLSDEIEDLKIVGRDAVLPLSCTVCCGLLFLEKMAATGIKTASKLADFETSLAVSAA